VRFIDDRVSVTNVPRPSICPIVVIFDIFCVSVSAKSSCMRGGRSSGSRSVKENLFAGSIGVKFWLICDGGLPFGGDPL
jgi:hypothetical protein